MTHRLRHAASIVATALTTACLGSLGRSVPATELYRLSAAAPRDERAAAAARGRLEGTVAVLPFESPRLYAQRGIVYRLDATRYGVYAGREWAISLGDMLGALTTDALEAEPLTRDGVVFDPPSRRGVTYVWRGAVREFEEVDRGTAVFAAVHLEAQLVRASDDVVVWSGRRRLERAVPVPTMAAIVDALSSLASEAISGLIADAKLAAPAIAGAPPAPQR